MKSLYMCAGCATILSIHQIGLHNSCPPKGAIMLRKGFKLKGVNNVYMGKTSPPMMNGHLEQ